MAAIRRVPSRASLTAMSSASEPGASTASAPDERSARAQPRASAAAGESEGQRPSGAERASTASAPDERSARAQPRASEAAGESEGQRPSDDHDVFRNELASVARDGRRRWIYARQPAGRYYRAR